MVSSALKLTREAYASGLEETITIDNTAYQAIVEEVSFRENDQVTPRIQFNLDITHESSFEIDSAIVYKGETYSVTDIVNRQAVSSISLITIRESFDAE